NAQVEKVLQLARIERDNFQLNLEEVNLHELIEKIVASTRIKVGEQGGDIATDLKSNHPVISADRLHLTNILHNLIDNAMKYCKDCPEITIRTEDTENHLKLAIADRGIGIPQEYQARVFEKFYRVPTGNVHNVKGFGLGLYYIKNICRAHGWKIT